MTTNGPRQDQAAMDSMLDAALDALGDDDDDDDDSVDERRNKNRVEKAATKVPSVVIRQEADSSNQPKDTTTETFTDEKEEKIEDTKRPKKPVMGPEPPPNLSSSSLPLQNGSEEQMLSGIMQEMMKLEETPEAFLSMLKQMGSEFQQQQQPQPQPQPQQSPTSSAKPKRGGKSSAPKNAEVDKAISNLMEGMSSSPSSSQHRRDQPENNLDQGNEEEAMLQQLLEGIHNLGGGGDESDIHPEALMDGMMEQLMSKELMYEPMKQVAEKFPIWLQEKSTILSEKELSDRKKQCSLFQKIVQTYEQDPQNTKRLVELMQQVQEYGQPPAEVIKEIAPGLELDEEGAPKIDFFDPNLKDECSIL